MSSDFSSEAKLFSSPEVFFGLKTSLNRLEDRFGRSSGGPSVVRLRSRDGADSRLSELSWGKIGDRVDFWEFVSEASGLDSCETCIKGEEAVVK